MTDYSVGHRYIGPRGDIMEVVEIRPPGTQYPIVMRYVELSDMTRQYLSKRGHGAEEVVYFGGASSMEEAERMYMDLEIEQEHTWFVNNKVKKLV